MHRLVLLAAAAGAAPRTSLGLRGRGLAAMSAAGPLKSVDYEVFGRVQGVCFRMYTEGEAKKIGVVGWVKNTNKGTVTGQVQGPEEKVNSINPRMAPVRPKYSLLPYIYVMCWMLWEIIDNPTLKIQNKKYFNTQVTSVLHHCSLQQLQHSIKREGSGQACEQSSLQNLVIPG